MRPVELAEGVYGGPMPRPWELEELVTRFDAVLSLSTPIEHAWMGYHPGALKGRVEFYWLPTPDYNAPPLNAAAAALARVLDWVRRGMRVYVHDRSGCGRLAMFCAALTAALRGASYVEAVATAAARVGCGLDSRAQLQLVRGLAACLRLGLGLGELAALDGRGAAVTEYGCTLTMELEPYAGPRLRRDRGPPAELARLAAAIAEEADYAVTWLAVSVGGGRARLRIQVWVPRGAHPRAARGYRPRLDRRALLEAWGEVAGELGLGAPSVDVELVEPLNPPPP